MSNPDVDAYIARSQKWPAEMELARALLLRCGLSEQVKWGKPCYSHDGKNIVILQEMKDFLALMFFKGALVSDPAGVLESQGPNSRSARRIRVTSVDEIDRLRRTIEEYIAEAIRVERSNVELPAGPELVAVPELQRRFNEDPALKSAFEALTSGRQREYHLHFSSAKQSTTRAGRVDKWVTQILAGRGLRDR